MKPRQVTAPVRGEDDYRLRRPAHRVARLLRREGSIQDVDTDGRDEVPPWNHIETSEI